MSITQAQATALKLRLEGVLCLLTPAQRNHPLVEKAEYLLKGINEGNSECSTS